MGANAQTTVQKFLSGAVLTAEQQNFSAATGVPVFATTVTRDAAFGGANKVLAEGQTCYLEDANVVQYYDGAAWASVGAAVVAQGAMGTTATIVTTTSTSFVTTGLTATITPRSTASKIMLVATNPFANGDNNSIDFTLFRGTVAGTNLTTPSGARYRVDVSSDQLYGTASLTYLDSPNTAAAVIYTLGFKVTAGTGTAQDGSRMSVMTLTEIL